VVSRLRARLASVTKRHHAAAASTGAPQNVLGEHAAQKINPRQPAGTQHKHDGLGGTGTTTGDTARAATRGPPDEPPCLPSAVRYRTDTGRDVAAERHDDLVVARRAAHAREAMGEDATAQVLGELALDVARKATTSASRSSASRGVPLVPRRSG